MQDESVEELGYIVGSNIRHFRLKKNLRQLDLALLSGITKTTVSNIECGLVWPEYDSLKAIMNVLEILPSELTSQAFRESEKIIEVAEDDSVKPKRVERVVNKSIKISNKHH